MVDANGPGFAAGDPARLFDKFQRGDERQYCRVGLGSRSASLIKAHGGEIEAHRRTPGARFEFTLQQAGRQRDSANASDPRVEDEPDIRKILARC